MSHEEEERAPAPSIWPVTLAMGVALAAFGLVTTAAFVVVGTLVAVVAIGAWIGEVRCE